jgi:membrane protease YdiL (CAAX protease family)
MESLEEETAVESPEAGHRLGPFKAIGIFLAYLVAQIAIAIAVAAVIAVYLTATNPRSGRDIIAELPQLMIMPATVLCTAGSGLLTLFLAWLCLKGSGDAGRRAIGWTRPSLKAMLIATAAGLLLSTVYVWALIPYFPPDPSIDWDPVIRAINEPGWSRHLWMLLLVFIAPLAEELLFRGVLLAGFTRRWSLPLSATIVTLLFVALHLPQLWGYLPGIFCIAGLGLATLLARVYSKSLGPAVALHAAYNLVIGISVYAS